MAQLYCASLPLVVNIYFTGTTVPRTNFYLAQRFLSGKSMFTTQNRKPGRMSLQIIKNSISQEMKLRIKILHYTDLSTIAFLV